MTVLPLLVSLPILLAQQNASSQSAPALLLECRLTPSPAGALRVTIRNPGSEPIAILLGRSLGNGQWYELRDLALLVKRPNQEDEEYEYRSRGFPTGVAGRMDHWILTLPRDASYSLTVSPLDFFSPRTGLAPAKMPAPAALSIRLRGGPVTYDLNPDMAGLRTLRLWTGVAISNEVETPAACPE